MNEQTRTLTLLGGDHEGHTVTISSSVQAVVMTAPDTDEAVIVSPARTAAPLIHTTYTVHPTLPYATTPDVNLNEYTALRDALTKLKPGRR